MAGEATPIAQETHSYVEGQLCVSSSKNLGRMEDHFEKAHTEMRQAPKMSPDQNNHHPEEIEGPFSILPSGQIRQEEPQFRPYFIHQSKAYTEAHMAMTEERSYLRGDKTVIASPKEEDVNTFSISISGTHLPDNNKEYLNFVFIPPLSQRFDSGLRSRGRT